MDEHMFQDHVELAMAREVCFLWYSLSISQNHPPLHAKNVALKRAQLILKTRGGGLTLNQKNDALKALSEYLDGMHNGSVINPLYAEE